MVSRDNYDLGLEKNMETTERKTRKKMWRGDGVCGNVSDWMEESSWSWREATEVKCGISKTTEYHIQKGRGNLTRTEWGRKSRKKITSLCYRRRQYKNKH